ncbi:MAG: carbohydrate kinase family protein [Pseudomonadota bacterium]
MLDLLAIGGAHIDRAAQLLEPHIAGASNPAHLDEMVGGGAFNAARNAKMLNAGSIGIMSIRGGDGAGQTVEDAIDKAGLADLSGTFMDRSTPTYTSILDVSGELITAIADMALYETGFDRQVKRLEGRNEIAAAKHILIDANLPSTAIESVIKAATGPAFAMCISPAKAKRLLPFIDQFYAVFLNRRELASLTEDAAVEEQIASLAKIGTQRAVITNGAEEVLVLENDETIALGVPSVERVVDVTGAGDALTGATIASMMSFPNLSLRDCVTYGIAAAQMTLQFKGPVCNSIATSEFEKLRNTILAAQTS